MSPTKNKFSSDDLAIEKKGAKKLNNYHRAILSACLTPDNGTPLDLKRYNTIFDFDKNEISDVKEFLPSTKKI